MENMANIGSDRETACDVCNHRHLNGSRYKVDFDGGVAGLMQNMANIGRTEKLGVVCVITDFRTDRETKFIFGGWVAGLMQNMANIGSNREVVSGVSTHLLSNASRYEFHIRLRVSGAQVRHGQHRITNRVGVDCPLRRPYFFVARQRSSSLLCPPSRSQAAICSFVLWAWSRFFANSSVDVHRIENPPTGKSSGYTRPIKLTLTQPARISRLGCGRSRVYFFVCHAATPTFFAHAYRYRPVGFQPICSSDSFLEVGN
jgi:hypothetical protein